MPYPRFFLLLLCALFMASCQQSPESAYETSTEPMPSGSFSEEISFAASKDAAVMDMPAAEQMPSPQAKGLVERKLIKRGRITFQTSNMPETLQKLQALVKQQGGYISSEESYTYSQSVRQTLTVRLPAKSFDLLLKNITEIAGSLESKSVNASDVTEEFVDITSRLRTKKALEARYSELLAKATAVEDLLKIERQIGELREEIEAVEGRLRYLNDQVSMSTLEIEFYKPVASSYSFENRFGRGFVNGWNNLLMFFLGLVNVWPFVLLLPIVLVVISKFWKQRKRKKATAKQTGEQKTAG